MTDTDIVERLRFRPSVRDPALREEAAQEIERLRERCEALIQAGQDKGKTDGQVFLERVADKKRITELEADNGKLRSLLETWLNHPYNIPLRTRTKAALNKEPDDERRA